MTSPEITIVVPSRGRRSLDLLLAALVGGETSPDRFEIVVVLDGSDAVAPTPRDDLGLSVVRQARSGPASARNRGAATAQAPVLGFIDDDCEPAPDWVTRMAAHVRAEPDALVGGRVLNAFPHNRWAETSQLVLAHMIEHTNRQGRGFVPSCNMGLRADRFAALGGFDERFDRAGGEDRDFCDRWRESGGRVVCASNVVVRHHHDLNFAGFWRQHRNYGRGGVTYQRARRARGFGVSIAPNGFYPSLAAAAARERRLVSVVASQVAYVSGAASGFASRRQSR